MLRPFEVKINVEPVKLRQIARKLEAAETEPPPEMKALEVLRILERDVDRFSESDLIERWYRRTREVRLLLFEFVEGWPSVPLEEYPYLNQARAVAEHVLDTLLHERWYNSWLMPAVKLWYQKPEHESLLDRIRNVALQPQYETPLLNRLRTILPYCPSAGKVAEQLVHEGQGLKDRWHDLALGNTEFGSWVLAEVCESIFSHGRIEEFQHELLGDFSFDNRHPVRLGLLHEANQDTFAKVISHYCQNVEWLSDNDSFAWFAKDQFGSRQNIGGWKNPNLIESARKKLWNWLVRKNIKRFLDELVEDPDRKMFYLRLSNLVDDLRFFVESYRVNHLRQHLDFQLSPLSLPTIMIKIGRLILLDSCRHGEAGVYIYPDNGPIQWDTQFDVPRDYKGPMLDHPGFFLNLPEGWFYKRHVPGWQQVVESHIRGHM